MNVLPTASGRKSVVHQTVTPSKKLQEAEQRLNFYTEAPTVELSIDDFEVFALKRLKVSVSRQTLAVCMSRGQYRSFFSIILLTH